MKKVIKFLVRKVQCLFGRHDDFTAFSWRTGAYETYCKRCGKAFKKHD